MGMRRVPLYGRQNGLEKIPVSVSGSHYFFERIYFKRNDSNLVILGLMDRPLTTDLPSARLTKKPDLIFQARSRGGCLPGQEMFMRL
jgi:hypothetical protein